MIAGNEAMTCGVHLDAKKLISWFSTCHVGLQFTGLPTHVLSHISEVSQLQNTYLALVPRFALSWDISEGLVLGDGKPKVLSDR